MNNKEIVDKNKGAEPVAIISAASDGRMTAMIQYKVLEEIEDTRDSNELMTKDVCFPNNG